MNKEKIHYYHVLLYIAYGFYLLFSLAWFVIGYINSGRINFLALFVIVVFAVQAYHKHLLTNLILGILLLFMSIYGLLESFIGLKGHDILMIDKVLIALPALSIIMSGILVFSYIKLNFRS